MKKIYLFLGVSLMLSIAEAAPNYWKTSYEQGVMSYSLTNHEGNSISIECNDAGFVEMDHGVSVYLKDDSMPLRNEDGDEALIEFVINGIVYNVPTETFSRRGSSKWMSLVEAISEANAFEVLFGGEYLGGFSSKNIEAVELLKTCKPMEVKDFSGSLKKEGNELVFLAENKGDLEDKLVLVLGYEGKTYGELSSTHIAAILEILEYHLRHALGYRGNQFEPPYQAIYQDSDLVGRGEKIRMEDIRLIKEQIEDFKTLQERVVIKEEIQLIEQEKLRVIAEAEWQKRMRALELQEQRDRAIELERERLEKIKMDEEIARYLAEPISGEPFKIIAEYLPSPHRAFPGSTTYNIVSLENAVTINKVLVNRGNCEGVFDGFPKTLRYGEVGTVTVMDGCRVMELVIFTNKGNRTYSYR